MTKKTFGLFDLIGPVMIGPSSSHTAGAARIGYVANQMAEGEICRATVTLYGSFAKTGRGHGTDKAITAGLLGMKPDDERLKDAFQIAEERGIAIDILFSDEEVSHPNTARILMETETGRKMEMVGVSVGGGNIEVRQINGMDVTFTCDNPTIIIFHHDRPGVIRFVTTRLAEQRINIAAMHVFRQSRYENACMVIETDGPVPAFLLQHMLEESRDITEVCQL